MISHSWILLEIGGLCRRPLAKTWQLFKRTSENGDWKSSKQKQCRLYFILPTGKQNVSFQWSWMASHSHSLILQSIFLTLDRSLKYRRHLESLRKKLNTRVSLIRRLAGISWGADALVQRSATLALVHSTAEYCALVWCRTAHTRLIDLVINNAMRIVTGCLLPTPTDYLTVLAGIPPAELHRRQATLTLASRALEPNHLLHHKIIRPELRQSWRLTSRHPFVPAARELLSSLNQLDIRAADWAQHSWSSEWNNCNTRLHHFIYNIDTPPPGMHLARRSWVRLNHLRTDVGRFRSSLHNWGMVPSAACDCDAENQTAEHILAHCPLFSPPRRMTGLVRLDDDTIAWLHEFCPDI